MVEAAEVTARLKHGGQLPDGWEPPPPGLISAEDVAEEVNRRLYTDLVQRKRFHCLVQHLAGLKVGGCSKGGKGGGGIAWVIIFSTLELSSSSSSFSYPFTFL